MSSLSSNVSKLEKEKQKLIQEKCQALLNEMLRDEDNKYCVDCDAKGPRWASWNLGIFLCIRCAGIHRNLGVHISRVKSVNLDTWTPEQVVTIQQMGNSRGRAVYEANLPDTFRRPQTDSALEQFIRAKYEHNKYIAKEWVKPTVQKVNWDSEIEEAIKKKKESKKHHGSTGDIGPLPAPKTSKTSPAPVRLPTPSSSSATLDSSSAKKAQSKEPSPLVQVTVNNTTNDDLLGLSLGIGGGDLTQQLPTTPATNQDELGSLFLTPEGSGTIDFSGGSTSSQKMTKESILSLYGSSSSGTTPVGGQNINPFLNPYPQQQQQQAQQSAFFGGSPNLYQNPNQIGGQFPTPTQVQHQQPNIPNVGIPDHMFGAFQQTTQPPIPSVQDPLQNQFFGLNLGNPMPATPQTNQFGNMVPIPNGTHPHHHPGILGMGLQQPQLGVGVGGLGNLMGMNMNMGIPGFNKMGPGTNLPGLGTSVNQLLMKPNGAAAHASSPAAATANLSLGNIWK